MNLDTRFRISLGINVALTAIVGAVLLSKSDSSRDHAAMPPVAAAYPGSAPAATTRRKLPAADATTAGPELRRELIDELRAKGVPENVLARFAYNDIEESWADRFEACRGDQNQLARVQLEHDMGLDDEMRRALGATAFKQWDQKNLVREAMLSSPMPLRPGEADAIYDLKKQLQRKQWELSLARQKGAMDDVAISKANDDAYNDFSRQMKTVLGEDRYAQAMRGDDGTAALKDNLAKVNATDTQFQQLLAAQQQLNERREALDRQFHDDPSSELYVQRMKTLNEEQNATYRRVLGDAVFDTLQKSQDGSYAKMKQFSGTWGLDDTKIDTIYGALKYYQKSVEDYQDQLHLQEANGQRADWTAVGKNVQQLTDQTRQSLQKYLGDELFNRMLQSGVFPFANQQPTHSPTGQ
jgi:hypothetical protein